MRRLKNRRAPLFATLFAVALGAALVATCGGIFETALRLDAPPEKLASGDIVVVVPDRATLTSSGDARLSP